MSCKAAAIGLFLSTLCFCVHAKEILREVVFSKGENGYHTYRIPALLTSAKGTLLAFCEGRKNGASDSGDIDIVMKRSTDGGKTWSKQTVIWDDSDNTCGNPCVLQDQQTKTIFLLLTHNLGKDHESEIHAGTSQGTRTVWLMKSDDDGTTWSTPKEITSQTKLPEWRWYATGPGVGIQIQNGDHKGRLIVPCDHSIVYEGKTESQSHVIYSDDHGQTWQIGGTIRPAMNECQVAEISKPKGALLISMRNLPKGSNRAQSWSNDGGLTWSEPQRNPTLLDPTCQASLVNYNYASNTVGTLLFSNPANSAKRRNLVVRASEDNGKTWSLGFTIHDSDAAYSCLTVLPDKEIGCLFEGGETNAYQRINFARFPLSQAKSNR